MSKLNLTITTPRGEFYSDEINIITLNLSNGYMGVMANKSPIISSVETNLFYIKEEKDSKDKIGVVSSGLFSTDGVNANLITDKVYWLGDLSDQEIKSIISEEKSKLDNLEGIKKEKTLENIKFFEILLKGDNG